MQKYLESAQKNIDPAQNILRQPKKDIDPALAKGERGLVWTERGMEFPTIQFTPYIRRQGFLF